MKFKLTKHASQVIREREIQLEWVERTLSEPSHREPDPDDVEVERHYRRIPEFQGRVLRVAVNINVEPVLVVSVFFGRKMRNRL